MVKVAIADAPRPWLEVRNGTAGAAEILITGQIGRDWWSDDGVSEKEFKDALAAIPLDREITVGINSEGGEIKAGLGIYNALQQRKDRVTVRIDGYAVSIASVIALAGKRTISPKSSIWMIHEPWTYASGNAEDFTRAAEMLEQHAEMLVDIYAEHTGKTPEAIRAAMKKETWLRGSEALDFGLCDECPDEGVEPKASFDLTVFKNVPDYVKNFAIKNGAHTTPSPTATTKENHMDRNEIIAALKARGDEVDEKLTTEQLKAQLLAAPKAKAQKPAATDPSIIDITAELAAGRKEREELKAEREAMRAERDAAKKEGIKAKIQAFADEGRIDGNAVDSWLELAVVNDKAEAGVLKQLAALPVKDIGAQPTRIDCVSESFSDVSAHIIRNSSGLTSKFIGANAGRKIEKVDVKAIHEGMVNSYSTIMKHKKMLLDALNTNTIDSNLKRNVILTTSVLREFEIPLLPLRQFCTVFESVPLEGTDKVEVPFLDLQGANESKEFDRAAGYTATGNSAIGYREITVGGDGDTATSGVNATAGTVKSRLYQDISATSYETNRQPWLLLDKLFGMKGEQLGVDVFKAVVGRLIVSGNYATATTRTPGGFSSDDIAALWEIATGAKWPTGGRQLTLSHQYNTPLIRDPGFKAVYASGTDETLRRAEIRKAYGFDDINMVANLDTHMGENGGGWISVMDALLIAVANIVPNEKVRSQLTTWNIVGNPGTGISFAHRAWGSASADTGYEIIECSLGGAKGRESGMQIIKKQ